MITKPDKNKIRRKRLLRNRSRIAGSPSRPRLNVFRSLAHIYAQLIDDTNAITLAAAHGGGNIEAAKLVGADIAKKALEKGITEVVFDRAGYIYHGRVKALAEAAREGGLKF